MRNNVGSKPLQLISTKDIGVFAAKAIENAQSPILRNEVLPLAGDELTQRQALDHLENIYGKPMPTAL